MLSRRQRVRPAARIAFIKKYLASGLTQKEFCQQEKLAYPTFLAWLRKHRSAEGQTPNSTPTARSFVSLQLEPPAEPSHQQDHRIPSAKLAHHELLRLALSQSQEASPFDIPCLTNLLPHHRSFTSSAEILLAGRRRPFPEDLAPSQRHCINRHPVFISGRSLPKPALKKSLNYLLLRQVSRRVHRMDTSPQCNAGSGTCRENLRKFAPSGETATAGGRDDTSKTSSTLTA